MVTQATIEYSLEAQTDILRLSFFLLDQYPSAAVEVFEIIKSAIELLASHPLAGRLIGLSARELVISHGKTGYIASYYYDRLDNKVIILAIKHQRENDYH